MPERMGSIKLNLLLNKPSLLQDIAPPLMVLGWVTKGEQRLSYPESNVALAWMALE